MKNKNDSISLLNRTFANEWISYHQYWIDSIMARGMWQKSISNTFMEHAYDERKHAERIGKRILELGGEPILSPFDWKNFSTLPFCRPKGNDGLLLLAENIAGEKGNIKIYSKIFDSLKDNDCISSQLILNITEEEIQHEEELLMLYTDLSEKESYKNSFV